MPKGHWGYAPNIIKNMLGYPKTNIYNQWKLEGETTRKCHKPKNDKKQTLDFLAGLKCSVMASPGTPISTLAKNHNVSRATVSWAINDNLKMKSYTLYKCHILTEKMKTTRVENGKKLLNNLKSQGNRMVFFSDEKNWTMDRTHNVQNDRCVATGREDVPHVFMMKSLASIMSMGVISSNSSIMPPIFFEPKERVGTDKYCEVLSKEVISLNEV